MIIDSGSKYNLISQSDWRQLCEKRAVMFNSRAESANQFRAYASDHLLKVLQVFEAPISVLKDPELIATFYVIENSRQSLLGRDTATKLKVLRLGLDVHRVEKAEPFPKWHNVSVKLSIDKSIVPVKQPMRRVPTALESKITDKLEEALSLDIIEPVLGPSAWISPIVIAFKDDGDIRVCLDMRRANKAIQRENYPLPTFETFMTKLKGAKYFSRLDLKSAYHQLELTESSREITTFITHRGLFRYKRLMFGVNSAPEIFQRLMEEMLAPCQNSLNYIDDVIIFGSNIEEHDKSLAKVKEIFQANNVALNEKKCAFRVQKLKFLGHILSDKGIEVDPEKVKVITSFRAPKNKEEVRSFLGLVTYIGKFVSDLADNTEPLRKLLKSHETFCWGQPQEEAFQNLKVKISAVPMLSYFNLQDKTCLIADASPVALGAVLVQFDKSNTARIISFASKSLSSVERKYSQTEKESLALVWAVEKFYYYLAGLQFDLITDHKPLETIFKPTSRPPARIERWLLRLQSYRFRVVYKAGKENIADSLSRLCEVTDTDPYDWAGEEHIFRVVSTSVPKSLSISKVTEMSIQDEEIIDVMTCLGQDSWNSNMSSPYYPFRLELSIVGNILLRGTRLVIPQKLREPVLDLAHEGHPGISAMKRRLRSKVWWPCMDKDAEQYVKECRDCLLVSMPSHPAPMKRHPFPNGPWRCLATDLLGPLPNGENILVLIDYYSRYIEFKLIKSISSKTIIEEMEEIFSRLGFPETLTTDNGRQFVSSEFKSFCETSGIRLMPTPPYWPQANGEVENMNRSLVKRLKIAHANNDNYKKEIQKFVLMYNVTPHGTTGAPPTELMFNRVIRDKIPGIQDLVGETADSEEKDRDVWKKEKGRELADSARKAGAIDIKVGDKVLLKNVVFPHKLTPTFDTTTYEVTNREGNVVQISGGGKSYTRNSVAETLTPQETPATKDHHDPKDNLKLRLEKKEGVWRSVSAAESDGRDESDALSHKK
nr:uncharacterized protein K02A2.6-like [Drosophila kikkawai]